MHIIITDFNGFSQTEHCLDALRASFFQDFTVVVVDHGTSDETRKGLAGKYPEVVRLPGSPDLWWAGATNLGIRHALDNGAETILLLNNDCYVTPETIGELVELQRIHGPAIFAPVQRDWQSGTITTIIPRCLFLLGFPSLSVPGRLTPELLARRLLPTGIIAGGRGALVHASIFCDIGLFDEKYLPHYWADHDFYLRARKKGYMLFIVARVSVNIDNSRTTMADNPGRLTMRQWIQSLKDIRSHRNLIHVTELFKRHYPVKHLYIVGVILYTGRYLVVYLIRRIVFLFNRVLAGFQ